MSARLRRWYEERGWKELPWFAARAPVEPEQGGLFEGTDVRAILRRLAEDDPLELGALAELVLSDEALLVHPERLHARVLARVAREAALKHPITPSLVGWMRAWTTRSLKELVEEDEEDERGRLPLAPEELAEFRALVPEATRVDPELTRLATVVFNRFPFLDRVPFYRAAVEGFSIEHVAADLNEPVAKIAKRIQRVADRLVTTVSDIGAKRKES